MTIFANGLKKLDQPVEKRIIQCTQLFANFPFHDLDEMACRKEDSPVLQLFLQMIWLHKIDSACTNSYRTVEISF